MMYSNLARCSISTLYPHFILVVTLTFVLLLMGRSIWCACGEWHISSWQVASRHNSQHLIDWYSPSHVLHGFIFYWLLAGLLPSLAGRWRLLIAMAIES